MHVAYVVRQSPMKQGLKGYTRSSRSCTCTVLADLDTLARHISHLARL